MQPDYVEQEGRAPRSRSERRGVIIVGPGKHFGTELIARFAQEGFHVGVIARTKANLPDEPSSHLSIELCDIGNPDAFHAAVQRLSADLGPVFCLIYNAKVSVRGAGLSTPASALAESMAINVTGALVGIQAVIPAMLHNEGACIILTGGNFKDQPDPERFALSVGKAGLHGVSRALVRPLQRQGIALKTVIIKGAIRRSDPTPTSSSALADFFWAVFKTPKSGGYVFPQERHAENADQRMLPF